jgi:uncharacterized protein
VTPLARHEKNGGQEPVLALLGKVAHGKRIDTHASYVFLEADRVLKIKRAVRLPFLDFSTLEKRKRACEEELLVNKRNAPALYRRVVPITQGPSGPEIDGSGEVIEWAVEMARFDERNTFDHLAARGEITSEFGEALAEVMLASHRTATVCDGVSFLASIAPIIDRNMQRFCTITSLAQGEVERLHGESQRRLKADLPLLQQRAAAGLVRRCHGDAHLGNIVLISGKPVLFDAIEFDPVIATTDVLYDLAFPLMDLIHFEQAMPASALFNGYLQATWRQNADALRLLPLYLSIRAAIRAHVLFTKAEQSTDEAAAATQARSYFDLALRLITLQKPSLIAVGGRSGTGKSVLARSIAALQAPAPGAVLLRSDVIRKELFGIAPLTGLPKPAYAADVTARVYQIMSARAATILKQGLSVVLDATFLREAEREELPTLAKTRGATFHGLFLDADINIRLQRIGARGPDASDADSGVASIQQTYDIGQLDWPKIDASGSPQVTLAQARAYLRS